MLENLDEYLGYIDGGEIIASFDRYTLDENNHLPLRVYKKWGFYEIDEAYSDAYDDLELTFKGFRVNVSYGGVDDLAKTIELLEYEGKDSGTLDLLAKGSFAENVPITTLKEIRMKMIKKLSDLYDIKRRYVKTVAEANDPQTIKDIKLNFDMKEVDSNA